MITTLSGGQRHRVGLWRGGGRWWGGDAELVGDLLRGVSPFVVLLSW
jgi:hypothetical protein